MISLAQCRRITGLKSHELILCAEPSDRQRSLLASYLLSLRWGESVVLDLIIADLRSALDLGALTMAADLLWVLRGFLQDHPGARCAPPAEEPEGDDQGPKQGYSRRSPARRKLKNSAPATSGARGQRRYNTRFG
jgi:hypothetical protein